MRLLRGLAAPSLLALGVTAVAIWLWSLHARAWDLGGRSPVLGYDAARVAVAAGDLAHTGRLATSFALPIELVAHARPPWPLTATPPGPVLVGAVVERLAPQAIALPGGPRIPLASAAERSWLALALPLASYLFLAVWLAWAGWRLLARHAPSVPEPLRAGAGATLALSFLLDPEVQLFVAAGYTELPFAAGLVMALTLVAAGWSARRPLRFGLLLGAVGSFASGVPWLAPWFALATAWTAPDGARVRAAGATLLGFALVLSPWWIHQALALGAGADVSRWMPWDGVEGRTWFAMLHLPEHPAVPAGTRALALIGAKLAHNLPGLALALGTGPRALWIGAIAAWLATRPPRPLAAAGAVALVLGATDLLAAAATLPGPRPLFPVRVALEAAGILATWALVLRSPAAVLGRGVRSSLTAAVAALALLWGMWQSGLGLAGARAASLDRGLPATATMADLASRLDVELPPAEPVMSNLGPSLAYYGRRPVVHLALGPDEVEACRSRLPFAHVVLAFRDPSRAWPEWRALMEGGGEHAHPEWNVSRARRWRSADGFAIVWIELGLPRPQLAAEPIEGPRPAAAGPDRPPRRS